jgi:hypothetical protein
MAPAKGNVIVWLNLTSSGTLNGTSNTGDAFVTALGLTSANFNA